MTRLIRRAGLLGVLVLGVPASAARAQEGAQTTAPEPRWTVEGAAGLQVYYDGSAQSVAFGFSPNRSLTVLVSAERTHIQDRVALYEDGYSAERGGTEQFVTGGVRYAFLTRRRVAPYVLGGIGCGISRPNVNEFFPDRKERNIHVLYYGGGGGASRSVRDSMRSSTRGSSCRPKRPPITSASACPCVGASRGASEATSRVEWLEVRRCKRQIRSTGNVG